MKALLAVLLLGVLCGGVNPPVQQSVPRGVPVPRGATVPLFGVLETGAPAGTALAVADVYPWSYSASQPYPACASVTSTTCGSGTCTATITQPTPAINTDMWIGITGQSDAALDVLDSATGTWSQDNAGTVTINTAAAHNLTTGDVVAVQGPTGDEYIEGIFSVTVSDTDTFTYSNRAGLGTPSGTTGVTVVWAVQVTAVAGNDVSWASSNTGTATGGTLCPKRKIHPRGTSTFTDETLNAPRRYLAATFDLDDRPEDNILHNSSNLQVISAGSHCNAKRCVVLGNESGFYDVWEYAPGSAFTIYWNLSLPELPLLGKGPTDGLLIYGSGADLLSRTLSTQSAPATKRNFAAESCTSILTDGNAEGKISDDGAWLILKCNKAGGAVDWYTYEWESDTLNGPVSTGTSFVDNARPLDNGDCVIDWDTGSGNRAVHYAGCAGGGTDVTAAAHSDVTTDSTGQHWLIKHTNSSNTCDGSGIGLLKIALPAGTETCLLRFKTRAGADDFGADVHFSCHGDWCMFNTRSSGGFSAVEGSLGAPWFNGFPWWGEKIGIVNLRTDAIYWLAWSRHSFLGNFFSQHPVLVQ